MEDRPRDEGRLFDDHEIDSHDVFISARARLRTCDGYRVVSVCGVVLAHYPVGDRMGEAHAMVSLVEQGWAYQKEVARAFGCSERTVRRHQRRFETGGFSALGRSGGYPKGRPRLPTSRLQIVEQWKAKGLGNREIARRCGVSENAVRKLLRRLGWKREEPEQLDMCFAAAHPNLSAAECPASAGAFCAPPEPPLEAREDPAAAAHPTLSAAVPGEWRGVLGAAGAAVGGSGGPGRSRAPKPVRFGAPGGSVGGLLRLRSKRPRSRSDAGVHGIAQ